MAVEGRCTVVPSSVEDLKRTYWRVAFDVSTHVQAHGKMSAIVLERKKHAVVTVLLAKDLAIVA